MLLMFYLATGYIFFFLEQMRKLEESEKARREAEEAAEAARREMEDRDNGTSSNPPIYFHYLTHLLSLSYPFTYIILSINLIILPIYFHHLTH